MEVKKSLFAAVRAFTICVLLAAPIWAYVHTFGPELSHNHTRWAEMGSAMSGIYGPLLALLGFVVLAFQSVLQQQTTKHMFDQTHIQAANSEIAFYLEKLEVACQKQDPAGVTVGYRVVDEFGFPPGTNMRDPICVAAARRFHGEYPQLFTAWMAYQSVLSGLQSVDESAYRVTLSSAKQKAIVTLSLGVCMALDQAVWCWCEGNLFGPYLFGDVPT
jgi:hypothetical protein